MSPTVGRGPGAPRTERDVWSWLFGAIMLTVVGVVIGLQYVQPDKRMLAVLAAAVVAGIAWRLDIVSGIGLLVLALPYPRATVFGSTNIAMILLLLIMWLLRVSQGQVERPRRMTLDPWMLALLVAFVLSFYNVAKASHLQYALANFVVIVAAMALYYLIVNNIRSSADLQRLHVFQAISITSVCLISLYELNNPGGVLIPGWIDFRHSHGEALDTRNVRVGGAFFDFELLSEYCALSMVLAIFLFLRARSGAHRVLTAGLMLLLAFVQFATVTRGGIMALMVGLLYLGWMLRRRLNFVSLTISTAVCAVLVLAMNFYVANYTRSGDLLGRVFRPSTMRFEGGLPVDRGPIWQQAFDRMMQHPILGHGPYYSLERGLTYWYWPHNGYLYVGNLVGLLGLSIYLAMLVVLWRASRPAERDPSHPDYATAFLPFAHAQLLVFLVDQIKIDFLRNPIYTFQVFILFATVAVTAHLARGGHDEARTA
jgi:O-antigen ligase